MKAPKTLSIKAISRANADINVTPLVDVVLVLLIIFMVVTPLLEKDIGIQVPKTEKIEQPEDVPPDQLVVNVDASGNFTLNSQKVEAAEYVEKLRAVLTGRADGKKVVFVLADDAAPYARLVAALDGAKQAGAQTLAMTAESALP
jgi:biopolymer transport protein ExbD